MSLLPEDWHVAEGVYEPREDSLLLARVLTDQDLDGKTVLDVGTGSGIQAYIAAKHGADVTAIDVNPAALATAEQNLSSHGLDATFLSSDLFAAVSQRFNVIVFNPPYVPGGEELGTDEEQSWAGGEQGRDEIDRFLASFDEHLVPGGTVFLLQSSLNDIDTTLAAFRDTRCDAEVTASEKIPWERLVVIRAEKQHRAEPGPQRGHEDG